MAEATALQAEITKFDALAARWWDPNGPMKPLHRMNPVRIGWIAERLARAHGRKPGGVAPLAGLRVLDVGCGAGLASEALARLGAASKVFCIDAYSDKGGLGRGLKADLRA